MLDAPLDLQQKAAPARLWLWALLKQDTPCRNLASLGPGAFKGTLPADLQKLDAVTALHLEAAGFHGCVCSKLAVHQRPGLKALCSSARSFSVARVFVRGGVISLYR